ncbi:hypothetical protein FA13DRAFT_1711687 [Coprinellus micaceus]|uniref:Uncharacterized protein n=1 Tax=Coprinellus micaceus TaxID=71717 RepID=A0A4Y7T421_COPMI|nr:hypothetical protein FA13DRAFT_1711687 [Coprinellus micaceus]
MPPTRSRILVTRTPPCFQTADPRIMTAHFIRQIESNHVRTPTQTRPVPLHYNYITQSLSEWSWPYDTEGERRVPPSELESFRRTHRLRAPSCLCALLEGTKYTEARFAIVETVNGDSDRNQCVLNGEYVATCAKKRCGYFLALERFYPLIHLRLQMCRPRKNPLEPQELATIHDIDQSLRRGDGLFQLMTDIVVRGNGRRLEKIDPSVSEKARDALMNELLGGMSEERFWVTFAQCLVCKTVTLRKHFALNHTCAPKRLARGPYPRRDPDTPSPLPSSGSYSESPDPFRSSPAPTETLEFGCDEGYDVLGDLEFMGLLPSIGDVPEASTFGPLVPQNSPEREAIRTASSDGYLADDDEVVIDAEDVEDAPEDGVPSEMEDSFEELPTLTDIMNSA